MFNLAPRTRVILAFVVPFTMYAVLSLVALRFYDRPDVYGALGLPSLIASLAAGFIWLIPEYFWLASRRPFSVIASIIVPPAIFIPIVTFHEKLLPGPGNSFS